MLFRPIARHQAFLPLLALFAVLVTAVTVQATDMAGRDAAGRSATNASATAAKAADFIAVSGQVLAVERQSDGAPADRIKLRLEGAHTVWVNLSGRTRISIPLEDRMMLAGVQDLAAGQTVEVDLVPGATVTHGAGAARVRVAPPPVVHFD